MRGGGRGGGGAQHTEGKIKVSLPRRGKEEQGEKCPRHLGLLSFYRQVGKGA